MKEIENIETERTIMRKLTKEDVLTLREFSIKTYYDTFMNGNSEHVMQAYLDEAFAAEKLTEELQSFSRL